MRRHIGAVGLLAVALLAGCSGGGATDARPDLALEPGKGAIAGVVVDEAIRPVSGAAVLVQGAAQQRNATTGADGTFTVSDLEPGTYVLVAQHPLFDRVQASVEVAEGDTAAAKLQLTRQIFATPYSATQSFDGFLVCSVGFFVYASEECGEGVGVPCEVPVLGCQRVGGQGNNNAQWDFWLDGGFVRELVVDMVWETSSPTFDEAYLVLATDWTCDPFCIGNELNITTGLDPLRLTATITNGTAKANTGDVNVTSETRFSTFVWPDWGHGDASDADVAVNQKFQVFATAFYHLPGPPGWTFLSGEKPPF